MKYRNEYLVQDVNLVRAYGVLYNYCKKLENIREWYGKLHEDSLGNVSRDEVKMLYIGDPITRIGYLPVWCENCNSGIQISRVEIPEKADMIEFGDLETLEKTVPDFKQIMPRD